MAAKRSTKRTNPSPSAPAQQQLPGLSDFMRAMPNHLARSSLFAPVARGKRPILKDHTLISRSDVVIKFWGEQLDEAQSDVWMHAMREAAAAPLGQPVTIHRAAFLQAIGRDTGLSQYQWLDRAMKALCFAMIVIEMPCPDGQRRVIGSKEALHLLDGYGYDADLEVFSFRVDPRWRALYAGNQFALIDWQARLAFGAQQDTAKSIQRLVATSNEKLQRYNLAWLQQRLCSTASLPNFRRSLRSAFAELQRLEIISEARLEKSTRGEEQVVLVRGGR